MIRPGFLDSVLRQDLIALARDGSVAHRLARHATVLVLLDQGMSCEAIAAVLLFDDDTVRTWHRLYEDNGIEGLASFGDERSSCRLSDEQQDKLKVGITEALPHRSLERSHRMQVVLCMTFDDHDRSPTACRDRQTPWIGIGIGFKVHAGRSAAAKGDWRGCNGRLQGFRGAECAAPERRHVASGPDRLQDAGHPQRRAR